MRAHADRYHPIRPADRGDLRDQDAPAPADGLPDFLTVEEAARLLRIGRTSAYLLAQQWCATDGTEGLPVVRLGRLLRVPRHELERLAGGELSVPPRPLDPPSVPPSAPPRPAPAPDETPTAAPQARPSEAAVPTARANARRARRKPRDTQTSLFPADR